MPTAFSYKRFSTAEQQDGDSLKRQTLEADRYIEEYNRERPDDEKLVLDKALELTDQGVSAFKGRNAKRGALSRFMELAEGKPRTIPEGSFLLIENFDRLSRDVPYEASGLLRRLIDAEIVVVTLHDGKRFDSESVRGQDGMWLLMMSVMSHGRASEESKVKSLRVSAAWSRKQDLARNTGQQITKKGPFWLTTGREVIHEKAQVVVRIFEMYASGHGPTGIAKILNGEGIPAPQGGLWRESTLKRILASARAVGVYTPNEGRGEGHAGIEGYYPAIISDELWWRAQRFGVGSKGRRISSTREAFPLAGLTYCRCGSTMGRQMRLGRKKGDLPPKRFEYLVCNRARVSPTDCEFVSVPYGKTLEHVMLSIPEWANRLDDGQMVTVETDLDAQLDEAEDAEGRAYELAKASPGSKAARKGLEEAVQRVRAIRKAQGQRRGDKSLPYRMLKVALDHPEPSNQWLRSVFSRIEIDPQANLLTLSPHHGNPWTIPLDTDKLEVL